ncbi:type III pantothenate kinase [Neotamlana laminarinivorans]|uniref:Type III pantothenate kinase n=1 Tax=Neotamlana laminarinivorans TaxID=2883124 RepID=A0A9X1L5M0_9FLAO|nr:type III pantothenate kinase [Tamlana laminarinivorans]MCB4799556.1 type III pantothenate kinase [Tamlana laminarinivorans]
MKLIIDVGNTFIKLAIFNNGTLLFKQVITENTFFSAVAQIKETYEDTNVAIISSVGKLQPNSITFLNQNFKLHELSVSSILPFKNLYATPYTLGVDRLALVLASIKHFSNKNVLIIDAGTCITFDFINNQNEYLGGAISPGLKMRYQALHNFTAKLPLLKPEKPKHIIGNSTTQSIHSGIVHGVLSELQGVVNKYKINYKDLKVVLTGGDCEFLCENLETKVTVLPDFLLEGLNYFLDLKLTN